MPEKRSQKGDGRLPLKDDNEDILLRLWKWKKKDVATKEDTL